MTKIDFFSEEEYYSSIDELLQEDDLVETDVRVLGWNKKFRIRALTFKQMKTINENATDKEGNLVDDLFTYHTIVEGVMRPKFTLERAKSLADKNGENVKELADQIWALGRLNKKTFDSYVEEAKRAIDEQNKQKDTPK